MDEARKLQLLEKLVEMLADERGVDAAPAKGELWQVFRAFVNTRPPAPAPPGFLELQDELLQGMIAQAGICGMDDAAPSSHDSRLLLWRGDITTFAADAIVNAANSQMLGCWAPGHFCIDNAIHTFAGIQLRLECARIMDAQGHEEPTGRAKITPAYNLPAKHVIHTVGPIANGLPTRAHRADLASCYTSCLDLATEQGLASIAFCCISTGVFGFPQKEAAHIAVRTVQEWLARADGAAGTRAGMQVVFNVFSAADEGIYRELLHV